MQIHPQPSEFRNLMIRHSAFHTQISNFFPHFLSLLLATLCHFPPQLCLCLCHLVPMPKRWTRLWFLQPGGLEWEPGIAAADSRIIYAALLRLILPLMGYRSHSSMCLQLSVVLTKNCNLRRQAWRCTSVEQSKLKRWRSNGVGSCG